MIYLIGEVSNGAKKLERAAELADRWGIGLHYGRCTQTRIRKALDAACDSGDSAHPVRLGSDRWARFLEVFRTETSVDRWWIARAS